jgi:hypothetical protein
MACSARDTCLDHASVRRCHQSTILIPVEDPEERPFGAIFWFEGHDLTVEPDVQAMERFIEPFDVADGEIYDERGRRLRARVIGERWPKRIELSVVDGEPQLSAVVDRVRAFLTRTGEPIPSATDASEWLREAAVTLLAGRRSGWLWSRIRRLWGRSP